MQSVCDSNPAQCLAWATRIEGECDVREARCFCSVRDFALWRNSGARRWCVHSNFVLIVFDSSWYGDSWGYQINGGRKEEWSDVVTGPSAWVDKAWWSRTVPWVRCSSLEFGLLLLLRILIWPDRHTVKRAVRRAMNILHPGPKLYLLTRFGPRRSRWIPQYLF
jgi:hypothetical protein